MLRLDPRSPTPLAPRRPTTLSANGTARRDDWFWLRDRDDPAVRAYLDAENAYTDAAFATTGPLRDALYGELLGRIQETDLGVPERRDGWLYYSRTEQGQQYPLFCRKHDSPDAPEVLLLDPNALAQGQPYFRLGAFEPSPDHALLAYSTDTDGNEKFDLVIKDTRTGALLGDRIENIAAGAEWSADGRYLFYATLDETLRPWQIHRHELGTDPASDPVIFEEADGRFFVSLDTTRSRRFIRIYVSSHSAGEVWLLDTERPLDPPRVVIPRQPLIEYTVEHHEDHLYIVTNDGAENFRLVEAPVAAPDPAHWRELIPQRADVKLDGVEAFRDYLVIWERADATPRVTVRNLRTGEAHRIAFPEEVFSVHPGRNPEFDSDTVRFTYTSLVTPLSVIDYQMATRTWVERKRQPVLGYDASRYRTARDFAVAADGARIPISLVWREGEIDGRAAKDAGREPSDPRPLLLRGYGAYGVNYDPVFSSNAVSLLDRGIVIAIAHIRGGEELGRPWYRHGKLLEKRNTFSDFIVSAEHLIATGWTRADRLVIWGGSAGGLLIGAVVNERPDLFAGAVAEVPFVDVLTTMLDESIPLTVMEYEEWGNPNEPEYFEYIRSYSPYDNVKQEQYPAMLVTAGLNDPRVGFWEPAKWVAKLRTMKTDRNPLLLRVHMGAGHSGASGRYDVLREVAEEYAFVIEAGKAGRREDGKDAGSHPDPSRPW